MTVDPKTLAAPLRSSGTARKGKATTNGQAAAETVSTDPQAAPPADEQQSPAPDAAAVENGPIETVIAESAPTGPASVLIECPLIDVPDGYTSRHIEFKATPRQAAAAKMLWWSLSTHGERFEGGRSTHPEGTPVTHVGDALRWFLDQYADAIEAETNRDLAIDNR